MSSGAWTLDVREMARDAAGLREAAVRRYTETDLLVAALHEHIEDLRRERDELLTQLARMRDDRRRVTATWLWRGVKANR